MFGVYAPGQMYPAQSPNIDSESLLGDAGQLSIVGDYIIALEMVGEWNTLLDIVGSYSTITDLIGEKN